MIKVNYRYSKLKNIKPFDRNKSKIILNFKIRLNFEAFDEFI